MSCERYRQVLTDHAAGAPLDGSAAAHLTACHVCHTWLESQRRLLAELDAELRREMRVSAAPGFSARVCARARDLPRKTHGVGARWLAAAATVALALVVYYTGGIDHDSLAGEPVGSHVSAPAPVAAVPPDVVVPPADVADGRSLPATRTGRAAAGRKTPAPARTAARPLEVQVPPTQRLAIARLQELAGSGVLRDAELLAGDPLASPPTDLTIAPLSVPDIVIPDVAVVTGAEPLQGLPATKESL